MLSFLPRFILIPFNFVTQILNLMFWGTVVFLTGLIKLLIPIPPVRRVLNKVLDFEMGGFGSGSLFWFGLTNRIHYDIEVDGELHKDGWYLIMANHVSWLDIMLLANFSAGRIPATKFFIKQELLWMPFVGLASWALDMPFMKRYSREYLEKHPHLKGKDIETTRKACEKFRQHPTTIVNFVEGTRSNAKKRQQKRSPFQWLMPPKAGGVAFTIATMGELFTNVLDITIAFPGNENHVMKAALAGKLDRIIIRVNVLPIESHMIGNYFDDAEFKTAFQQWLNERWQTKDQLLQELNSPKG